MSVNQLPQAMLPSLSAERSRSAPRAYRRWVMGVLILMLTPVMIVEGFDVRRWTWETLAPVCFRQDIRRNFDYGLAGCLEGYLNIYTLEKEKHPRGNYQLDYGPLRLLTFTYWAHGQREINPLVADWQDDYAFNGPLLRFFAVMELAAAVGMFLLVRWWVNRDTGLEGNVLGTDVVPFAGWGKAYIAAVLVWFNPTMVVSSHGWPSTDSLIVPFYIWGILLACWDWWFAAGIVIAVGTLFKGQMLVVCPLFVGWPLLSGKPGAAARWMGGFALGVTAITAPWLLHVGGLLAVPPDEGTRSPLALAEISQYMNNSAAIHWICWAVIGTGLATVLVSAIRQRRGIVIPAALVAAMIAIIYPLRGFGAGAWIGGVLAAAGIVILAIRMPWRSVPMIWGGVLAAALAVSVPLFNNSPDWRKSSSLDWLNIGILYGEHHYPGMVMGLTCNLPGIVQKQWSWEPDQIVLQVWPHSGAGLWQTLTGQTRAHWDWFPDEGSPPLPAGTPRDAGAWQTFVAAGQINVKWFSRVLFLGVLGLCIAGAAMHWRRRDARFLCAISAPWLAFFCLPTQIHERYLLFGSTIAISAIAAGGGLLMLDLFLVFAAWAQTIDCMFINSEEGRGVLGENLAKMFPHWLSPQCTENFFGNWESARPHIGWAIALACAAFLYYAVVPSWRSRGDAPALPKI